MTESTVEASQVVLEENIGEDRKEIVDDSVQQTSASSEENVMKTTTIITTTTTSTAADETDVATNQDSNTEQHIQEVVVQNTQQNIESAAHIANEAQQQSTVITEGATTATSEVIEKTEGATTATSEVIEKTETQKQSNEKVNEIEDKGKEIQNSATKMVAEASGVQQNISKNTKSNEAGAGASPLTECPVDKEEALYAMKVVRTLHGLPSLEWDDSLATQASNHAMYLAQTKTLEVSGVDDIGENIYVAKGTSRCSKVYQAVFEWYKSATRFNFKTVGTVSDDTGSFTQLAWDDTTNVGVGCVYAEDTRTSYIVANFSPPGNYGDARNYIQHVKQPVAGLPPRPPKLNDLMPSSASGENAQENSSPLSNMGSIFGVLCHWCGTMEDKPEIKVLSAKPKVLVKVKEETAKSDAKSSSGSKEENAETKNNNKNNNAE